MDITEITIPTFHTALRNGTTTCTALVTCYLSRITQYDSTLKTLITVNPQALDHAVQKDHETHHYITTQTPFPTLHGIPLILKDNITTASLPTSAGVLALQSLHATTPSAIVAHLLDAGAIVLAKANLHEFALQGTTTSSLGGQTLNPYDLTRTPGGSSGGTAAALAANLGLVGCGTDTMNSLRSPAAACAVVGMRPSRGEVSMEGIVPVSGTQDGAGPMGRCVGDVKVLFGVMRGNRHPELETTDMKGTGSGAKGRGLRVGVLEAYFGLQLDDGESILSEDLIAENQLVQGIVRNALTTLQDNLDITLVSIDPASHPDWSVPTLLSTADTQSFEFRECLDAFLQAPGVSSPHHSLESIINSGQYDKQAVTEVFFASLKDPETYCRGSEAYRARLGHIASLKESVERCFEENEIDALVYPHQRQLVVEIGRTVQPRRNGVLAALTGNPAICIPGGFWML